MGNHTSPSVDPTVMAMREEIMRYFKGTCVQRMTENSNIHVRPLVFSVRGVYRCDRTALERDQRSVLKIGDAPFALLGTSPRRIVFLTAVTNRSPQFRAIRRKLTVFAKRYLPAVDVGSTIRGLYESR